MSGRPAGRAAGEAGLQVREAVQVKLEPVNKLGDTAIQMAAAHGHVGAT